MPLKSETKAAPPCPFALWPLYSLLSPPSSSLSLSPRLEGLSSVSIIGPGIDTPRDLISLIGNYPCPHPSPAYTSGSTSLARGGSRRDIKLGYSRRPNDPSLLPPGPATLKNVRTERNLLPLDPLIFRGYGFLREDSSLEVRGVLNTDRFLARG